MIGVDYDLFWTLNPKSLTPFVKAFDLQRKHQDTLAWEQGIYIQMAIASVMNGKKCKYPNSPFSTKEAKREMSAEELKEKMLERMAILNSRIKGGS